MALPGNYALIPNGPFPAIAGVTLSGEKGLLENTYNITGSFESVTLVMKNGPQGRLYDSDLNVAGEARATLESFGGIGFSLGGVQFGSNEVAVWVGDQRFVYTKDQLDTEFIANFLQRWPDDIETAQIAADVIKAGMKIFSLAEEKVTAWGLDFPQPANFQARFVDANSGSYVNTPENIVETNGFNTDDGNRIAASGEDYVFVHVGEGTDADVFQVYHRTDMFGGSASGIQSKYNEIKNGPFGGNADFLLVEFFGYEPIGSQYVFNFDAAQIVQTGFDESFNFGPGTIDDGIVTGSDLADVIDGTYTDLDGTSVSDGDDIVHAGLGDDVITGGSGNDLLDGGAGTDTILLDGMRDEFVFSFDTNLTVQDTAPSSGVNEGTDTLIDIELVNFSDGSRAEISTNAQGIVITYFNAGATQVSVRTVLDSANAYSWSSYTQIFGTDGVTLIDRVTHYDDGRVLDVDYAGGVRTSQKVTDVADVFNWSDFTQTFGADGITVIDRVTHYDDGRVLDVDYAGGVRTSQTMTDVADVYSWASYTQIFDISGNLISTTYLDDVA